MSNRRETSNDVSKFSSNDYKMIWSPQALSNALNIDVHPEIYCGQVQFNSNDVLPGDLFIALQGNSDGHNYVPDALARGASAVIVSRMIADIEPNRMILVPDTLAALNQLAEYKRTHSKAKFIGVTGSSGKTSTKEAIRTVLSRFGQTFASRGNFNNHLGVPLNLASMPDNTEYAVIEMGMNHEGEIRQLTKMVKPDIALITTIAEAHLQFFSSMLHLTDAKCEIFEGLPKDGAAVINFDNSYYDRMLQNLHKLNINNIYSFGKSPKAQSRLISYEPIGDKVRLFYSILDEEIAIEMPFIPEHYARNYTAVLTIASILKLDISIAAQQLSTIPLTIGRGLLINARRTGHNYQIIADYYNSNPESLNASLEYLKLLSSRKKVAIIGDMLELGENSRILHERLVPAIIASGAQSVFLVGDNTKYIYELLPLEIQKRHFDNVTSLIDNINELLQGNELILIKGSRGIKLDKIILSFEVL